MVALAAAATTAAGAQTAAPSAPPVQRASPLLREGSFVLQAHGTLHRREADDWPVFRVAPEDPAAPRYELTLLPCTLLANLEQLAGSLPGQEIVLDLTGEVFVYRGRNYLLPTHAPRLVEYVPPVPPAAEPAGREPRPSPPAPDSPQSILGDLDRAVGPVARSSRSAGGEAQPSRALAPGTVLLWRRGWMAREPQGAWTFVFEADASGGADPPVTLMPCLLLEEMEEAAKQRGPDAPLLVSGRVYRYKERYYLLPTLFEIPRHHTPLRP